MIRIFIDLEMNMISDKHKELRRQLPHEIIEIGAVKLDENCRVIDRFCSYVRPRYNHTVHWGVAKLTGITAKTLKNARYLEEVLSRFMEWVGDRESVCLYAWSDSDRAQVEREVTFKNLWTPQLHTVCAHWTDFQKVFSRMVGYRNGLALSRAIEYMGLEFDGEKHDALSDAENCARLMALMLDEAEFARRKALVPPEPVPQRRPRKQPAEDAARAGEGAQQPDGQAAAGSEEGKTKKRRHRAGRRRRRGGKPAAGGAAVPSDTPANTQEE